ncbi:MAG: hypothetical protein WC969_00055 [Elusimicrobiota bacterium]|jgi:hypothetical protein
MRRRRVPAAVLAAALLLACPGLAPYEALAQTVAAGAAHAPVTPIVPVAVAPLGLNGSMTTGALKAANLSLSNMPSLGAVNVAATVPNAVVPAQTVPTANAALGNSSVARAVLSRPAEAVQPGLFSVLLHGARGADAKGQAAPEAAFLKPSSQDMASDSSSKGWGGNSFDVLAYGKQAAGKVSSALSVPVGRAAGWLSKSSLRPALTARREAVSAQVPAPGTSARPSIVERLRPYAKPVLMTALLVGAALLLTGCSGMPAIPFLESFSFKSMFTMKALAIQAGLFVVSTIVKKVLAKRAEEKKKAAAKAEALAMAGPSRILEAADVQALSAADPAKQPRLMLFSYDTVGFQEIAARDIGRFAPPAFALSLDEKNNIVYIVPTFAAPEAAAAAEAPSSAPAAAETETTPPPQP